MDIILAAVGRLKAEEAALFQRYWQRLRWKARLVELPEKGDKAQEAKALEKACAASPLWVCLDERGQDWDSPRFATWLGQALDADRKPVAFISPLTKSRMHDSLPARFERGTCRWRWGVRQSVKVI